MPRMTSLSRYLSWSAMRSGISARQGGHQVAQKLTRTTLPFQSLDESVWPLMSVTVKAGTCVGSLNRRTEILSIFALRVASAAGTVAALVRVRANCTPHTAASAQIPNPMTAVQRPLLIDLPIVAGQPIQR